jgi:hypothetical protein
MKIKDIDYNVSITPPLVSDFPISKRKLKPFNSSDCAERTAYGILEINELSEMIDKQDNLNEREKGFNEGLKHAVRLIRDQFIIEDLEE